MILVSVGTQKQDFSRFLDYIDKLVEDYKIEEDIFMQYGESKIDLDKYVGKRNICFQKYFDNFEELVYQARVIFCHGGVGIIMLGLLSDTKVIAVPREVKHHEHVNDHQKEIVTKFKEKNYILAATSYEELKKEFLNIDQKELQKYISNNSNFNMQLNKDINDLIK